MCVACFVTIDDDRDDCDEQNGEGAANYDGWKHSWLAGWLAGSVVMITMPASAFV